MWGIVPAAGRGSRMQPLAFSKELLPMVAQRADGGERPAAVAEHLLERMILAGVDRICMVIAPGKSDIMEYFGAEWGGARIAYVVQPSPRGLCDAVFRALPLIHPDQHVVVGLPDTIWQPCDALAALPRDVLSFLLFPVEEPSHFDAVVLDAAGGVVAIDVKSPAARSRWIWGAIGMPGRLLADLHRLWKEHGRGDEYVGTLVNAWLAEGNVAVGVKAGERYVDVGTPAGWRAAMELLQHDWRRPAPASAPPAAGGQGAATMEASS